MRAPLFYASCLLTLLAPGLAHAEPWVFKHDQFAADLATAATAINGAQVYTQPGFVAGEAFGQIYKPLPEMYPLQVTGFDVILAAPPNALTPLFANATIEIYNSTSTSADPQSAPIFTISTGDLFNPTTQDFGFPLQGGVGIHVDFGQGDPEDRPPMITEGNLWLVIRFQDAATDMSSQWGTIACSKISDPTFGDLSCGCQGVGTIHDSAITNKVNVIHHIAPLGTCSGSTKAWTYMENIPATSSGFQIRGDTVLRLLAEVAAGPCQPDCTDLQCGDDGCGGSCGTCGGGLVCDHGSCQSCIKNCLSKQCGDDGCGGSCGTCDSGDTCGADFFCHAPCAVSCSGKECGPDGCGGTCGSCEGGESCSAGQCIVGCAPSCGGKECGSDGCGGSCGGCEVGESCAAGVCQAGCAPACSGKECGDDGCGGSCGACVEDETCQAGVCTESSVAPTVAIDDISPDRAFAAVPTAVSITGHGFVSGAVVRVGAATCSDVVVTGNGLISATVPGLPTGIYNVIVANPDGAVTTLTDGFEVITAVGRASEGCASGDGSWMIGLGLAAAVLLAAVAKARRAC